MEEFRFKIGDMAILRAGIAESMLSAKAGVHCIPRSVVIVEQWTQTCHGGGTQRFYLVSGMKDQRITEVDLAAPEEFNVEEQVRLIEEHRARCAAEDYARWEAKYKARKEAK